MGVIRANGSGEAESIRRGYFADSPEAAARGPVPTDIEGDRIYYGAKVYAHREKDVPYPDRGYLLLAKKKGGKDLYIDVCPPLNIKFPLLYEVDHAGTYRRDPSGARRDPIERLFVQRYRCMRDFDNVKDGKELRAVAQKWAATEKNLRKALVANGTISEIKRIQRKITDPKYLVGLAQIRDYDEGYHGALNPSAFKRALLNVAYRPVIMGRAGLRTMRNPDEAAAKGTRTFWTNVPVGIAVSLLVAAVALIYLSRANRKST
jgi:hypothetical protein